VRAYDIIKTKRDGGALSRDEIRFFVEGCTSGEIPDYQASALLMAVYLRGMTGRETADLTSAMADSGERLDLSGISGERVDKHSTGGVGDKTTLIVAPIVAACGVKVAKMSGRGLGHTGGTTDKLLSIPNLRVEFSKGEFQEIVNRYGLCVCAGTADLAPADKLLYALRDVTATVDSIPLIAASIMSKKLAAGSKNLLLDVKTGSGAFMKTTEQARALAREMVEIGRHEGLRVTALLTDMDSPLGNAVGNSLEVIEAVNTLKGIGPDDLTELCVTLSAHMLRLAGKGDLISCAEMAKSVIFNGLAFERFIWMANAQGGDSGVLMDTARFRKAKFYRTLKVRSGGYIAKIDAERCGTAAALLGAGRLRKEDGIDMAAGLVLEVKPGAKVAAGDVAATMYAESESRFDAAEQQLAAAFQIAPEPPEKRSIVIEEITNIS